jgi:hypothetical protein
LLQPRRIRGTPALFRRLKHGRDSKPYAIGTPVFPVSKASFFIPRICCLLMMWTMSGFARSLIHAGPTSLFDSHSDGAFDGAVDGEPMMRTTVSSIAALK